MCRPYRSLRICQAFSKSYVNMLFSSIFKFFAQSCQPQLVSYSTPHILYSVPIKVSQLQCLTCPHLFLTNALGIGLFIQKEVYIRSNKTMPEKWGFLGSCQAGQIVTIWRWAFAELIQTSSAHPVVADLHSYCEKLLVSRVTKEQGRKG